MLRVEVPEGPLNAFPGKPWCAYFEYALRVARYLKRCEVALGEVDGESAYLLTDEDPGDAYEVVEGNRGREVLFAARGPETDEALGSIQKIFDGHSSFWKDQRRAAKRRASPEKWKRLGLPPCPPPREDWKPIYLRLGDPPPNGKSRCFTTGVAEEGMSVFRAYETPGGDYLVDLEENVMLALDFLTLKQQGRPVFVVVGEEAGTGVGNEPLLANVISCETVPAFSVEPTIELPAWLGLKARTRRGRLADFPEEAADFGRLLEAVLPYATDPARNSEIHGPSHWQAVFMNSLWLCPATPGADKHVALLFAVLHDSQRLNDGEDPDHGRRAAKLAKELRGVVFQTTDLQQEDLEFALEFHADGHWTEEVAAGVCWDADRLDLPRCGIQPVAKYLSTDVAKEMLS